MRLVPVLAAALALSTVPAFAAERTVASTLHVVMWPPTAGATLTAEELKIEAGGKPAKVLRLKGPTDDLIILLVLDLSGDLNAADQAKQALATKLGDLPANTWIAILRAQDGLKVLADPSPDRAPASGAIESLQVAGRAGTLEVVEPVAQLANNILKKTPVRIAVLIVTDSSIYNYREDYTNPVINPSDSRDLSRRFPENLIREKTAKLADQVSAFDPPIFIVHVGYSADRMNEAYQNGLRQIAEATGGAAWIARAPTEIGSVIGQAFDKMQGLWLADLELPQKLPKNFILQIRDGDLEPQYRSHYNERH